METFMIAPLTFSADLAAYMSTMSVLRNVLTAIKWG
ncbi:hypothetical protein GGR98_002915 [Parageobacillus caldoxylosilyticus]|nr:hypothetical protein [Parageobacillus caldoxylosilyticus]